MASILILKKQVVVTELFLSGEGMNPNEFIFQYSPFLVF
jgi:hypothetical protein